MTSSLHALGASISDESGLGRCRNVIIEAAAGTIVIRQIETAGVASGERVLAPERLLTDIPAARLTTAGSGRARHGAALGPSEWSGDEPPTLGRMRLLDADGALLGIGELRPGGLLHPVLVLV